MNAKKYIAELVGTFVLTNRKIKIWFAMVTTAF
jgi:hypothetical protein